MIRTILCMAAVSLLLPPLARADENPPRSVTGTIEPDQEVQAAFKRLINDKDGLDLGAVEGLAKISGAESPDHKVQRRATQHLAEQLFLYAVREKWAVEGYELYVLKDVMQVAQGTLQVRGSNFVIAAAPNIGHEDRTVAETAVTMLAFLDAFTPVKSDSDNPNEYHFRQLEPYLEQVQKLGLTPEEAASRVVLGMYRADPEAALNTMSRMTRRAARTDEQRRLLPDLRQEREYVARIHFAVSVGPDSDAAASLKPPARQCLRRLAESPHWYVKLYVPFAFLQDENLLDRELLDRLGADDDAIIRQAVGNVRDALQQREAIRRKAEEQYGGDK